MIQTIADALAERGYDTLTSVQEAVTAPELQDRDLLVSAQTGSGKTVGFGLAIARTLMGDAETLGPAAAPLALIVAPTRELALQVMRELGWLYAKAGARVVSCVGGMDMRDERRALERGAHIVVGTPGRLRDHIQRGSFDMSALRAIVLDEADEMLDLGFREDLEFMLAEAPEDRRTLLFSATVSPMIAKLAEQYQRDAERVSTINSASQHADITYQALRVAQNDAENAIINVLRYHDAQNALVFANTRAAVNRLAARFANRGFSVVSLSGELSQSERTHALQAMRDGRARVCVATDVAARGIDLPNLELVIHADLPSNTEALLHRSGRTGRAGRKGISALIVTPKIVKKAERLLKFAKIQAEWTEPPSADDIRRSDEERLLADPVWSEESTDFEQEFAAKLLALHAPEKIAAAYFRLYQTRQSAPEDLSPPDAAPAPRERKPFGPSTWISLSVGRDDRAEARWLLPLLLRAGDLQKDDIGAIRVQQNETLVELTEASAAPFIDRIGEGGELEAGVKMRRADGPPPAQGKPGNDRPPHRKGPSDKPRRSFDKTPRDRAPAEEKPINHTISKPTRRKPDAERRDAPAGKPDNKHKGKPAGKPGAGKTGGKPGGKPGFGKPAGKSGGKFTARPARDKAAPGDGKSAERKPRFDASDTSKRMPRPDGKPGRARPGAGKPGASKPGKRARPTDRGNNPPRRS